MNEFGEPLFKCALHPDQIIVGVCSSCLRERLLDLISRTDEENRREIIYIPDESSWGYLTSEKRSKDNDIYCPHAIGIPDPHCMANSVRSAVSHHAEPSKNIEWPTRTQAEDHNYSEEKKGRKKFSGLRSFFLRLEGIMRFKKDNKPADKIVDKRGNEAELHDRYESPRGYPVEYDSTVRTDRIHSSISPEVWSSGCEMPGGDPRPGNSSFRQSFSERRSRGVRRSCNGFALERSMSNVSETGMLRRQEMDAKKSRCELVRGGKRCSDTERDGRHFSDFFTSISCRNQAQVDVSHAQSGTRDSAGKPSSHGLKGGNPQKEGRNLQHVGANDILPNSKVWNSLNHNQGRFESDRRHRSETGTDNEGWVRALNRPKRSFHENQSHSARHEAMEEIFGGYKIALSP